MTLVPMEERHLDDLERLERLCFSDPWTREGLQAELGNPTAVFLAAEMDGKTAGYAGMHCVCGECYMDNVAVFPQFRGRGVGRELVRDLIRRAREADGEFLSLEVRPSNTAALALYGELGFKPAGRRRDFYRRPKEDALILTLFLKK